MTRDLFLGDFQLSDLEDGTLEFRSVDGNKVYFTCTDPGIFQIDELQTGVLDLDGTSSVGAGDSSAGYPDNINASSITVDDATVNNAPTADTDVARKKEVDAVSAGSVDGKDITPASVTTDTATVNNAPSQSTHVARQAELDGDLTPSSVDTASLNIDGKGPQFALNGMVVAVSDGMGVVDAIDPSSTTTPVQDAITAIEGVTGKKGGTILLPPTEITEDNTITISSGIRLKGWGVGDKPSNMLSVVNVTATDVDLIAFDDPSGTVKEAVLDGFALRGPGISVSTGPAIHCISRLTRCSIRDFYMREFANRVWLNDSGAKLTECNVERIVAEWFDPMAASGVTECIDWSNDLGVAGKFGVIALYPIANQSNSFVDTALRIGSGSVHIDLLNVGGVCKRAAITGGDIGSISISHCNLEPVGLEGLGEDAICIFDCYGEIGFQSGPAIFRSSGHDVSMIRGYQVAGGTNGNTHLGPLQLGFNDTLNTGDHLRVNSDTTAPVTIYASSGDVNNSASTTLTNPVSCFYDLTTVS